MSRNSKSVKLIERRKQIKRAKFDPSTGLSTSTGVKGPARTTPKHGKQNAWFQKFSSHGDYADSLKKGAKKKGNKQEKEEDVAEETAST